MTKRRLVPHNSQGNVTNWNSLGGNDTFSWSCGGVRFTTMIVGRRYSLPRHRHVLYLFGQTKWDTLFPRCCVSVRFFLGTPSLVASVKT